MDTEGTDKDKIKKLRRALLNAKEKAEKEARTCTYAERYMARIHARIEDISKHCVLVTKEGELRNDAMVEFLKRGVY